MKKNKISKDWINKRRRDIYVRQSKIEGYKSRAIYKLKEIDEKFKILKEVKSAVDLGAAPGSCCLLYTSPSPRDGLLSRMPSSA